MVLGAIIVLMIGAQILKKFWRRRDYIRLEETSGQVRNPIYTGMIEMIDASEPELEEI